MSNTSAPAKRRPAYVFGHLVPDTDSAVSAVMAARLLTPDYPDYEMRPILPGEPNRQTIWLFERAGIQLPDVRLDIRPCVGECCATPVVVHPGTPLGCALDVMRERNFSMLPVTDNDGTLLGVVSPLAEGSNYFYHFNAEDFLGFLFGIDELVQAVGLKACTHAARTPAIAPGSFRILERIDDTQRGDLVLTSHATNVATVQARGAAGVILCGTAEEVSEDLDFPVWKFRGSLMALVTSLGRAIRIERVMKHVDPVAPDQPVRELRERLARCPHALPVTRDDGRLLGVISRREALVPPRPGAVLVDHFESTQTVRGLDEADILEIIDHHRIGSLETPVPVQVDSRPLGSTATLVASRWQQCGRPLERGEALLLLGGMLADTLALTSPTTTRTDRKLAVELADVAGIDIGDFGVELLRQNDDLASRPAPKLVRRDLKSFTCPAGTFLAAQIETVDLGLLTQERRANLREALEETRMAEQAVFAMLMVTDVLTARSHLLVADPDEPRGRRLLDGSKPADGCVVAGMVSRKKQLLPWIFERLA